MLATAGTPVIYEAVFRWLRVVGDTIFAAGAVALAIFVIGLRTGGSMRHRLHVGDPASVTGQ